jgi:hypothetical protein
MRSPTVVQPTLATILWPRVSRAGAWRPPILVVIGVMALTVSAKVQIPFYPVPMTMQTFVVLVTGISYGSRPGVASSPMADNRGFLVSSRGLASDSGLRASFAVIVCIYHFIELNGFTNGPD